MQDEQRAQWIAEAMRQEHFTALICRLPEHIVMLTGYQPILGTCFCVLTLDATGAPQVRLAVPADEAGLVPDDVATTITTFSEETLTHTSTTLPSVREPLAQLLHAADLPVAASIGYEDPASPVASYYTQLGTPGPSTTALLRALLPGRELRDASALLDALSAMKSERELAIIRQAEAAGHAGFAAARAAIHRGATEADVAAATHGGILRAGYGYDNVWHVMAHVHVMSGPRAAQAYKAFNLTSNRRLERGDTVCVQMEVALNGYWAELTRPFFVAEASDQWRSAHAACIQAQEAALRKICAGVSGREADAAARQVMQAAGYGDAFKHGLGHGFGFQAINHAAEPVLHPASHSTLREHMVHNMEPAVYLDGVGGIRLNDNVLVGAEGNEVLSDSIPRDLEWLIVPE